MLIDASSATKPSSSSSPSNFQSYDVPTFAVIITATKSSNRLKKETLNRESRRLTVELRSESVDRR
ncbi:hypothetical protein Hanom_Chr16g01486801 [Helianthus anomalus]